jgi:chemotaxis protein CheC
MAEEPQGYDEQFLKILQGLANAGFLNAAKGFSDMLGQNLTVAHPSIRTIALMDIPKMLGGLENEGVGIYLRAEGDIAGQIMLILPFPKALELVDLLMGEPTGTTKQLGSLERSALAEVGNITGTFFLNTIASQTGMSIRPTPPAVMVDMMGAILDIIIATTGGISDTVLMFEANFVVGEREVEANFWIIPDPNTLDAIKGSDLRHE